MATITYNSCGRQNVDCSISLKGFNNTPPPSYPMTVFNRLGQPLGDVGNPVNFISVWNADAANQTAGTLELGPDDYTFGIRWADDAFRDTLTYVVGAQYFSLNITGVLSRLILGGNCKFRVGLGAVQNATSGIALTTKPLYNIPSGAYSDMPNVYRCNNIGSTGVNNEVRVWFSAADKNVIGIWGQNAVVNEIGGWLPSGLRSMELMFTGQNDFSITAVTNGVEIASNLETIAINNYGYITAGTFNSFHFPIIPSSKLKCAYLLGYQELTQLHDATYFPNLWYYFRQFSYGSYFPAPTFAFPAIPNLPRLIYGCDLRQNYQNLDTYHGGLGCDYMYNQLAAVVDYAPAFPGALMIANDGGYSTPTAASNSARTALANLGWAV